MLWNRFSKQLISNGNSTRAFILEVLHDAPGIDDALGMETLPINASLRALKLRLKALAENVSRQYIKDLALEPGGFWQDSIKEDLEMLSPEIQKTLVLEVKQFHQDLQKLRCLIVK
jgi:hypothetical protein